MFFIYTIRLVQDNGVLVHKYEERVLEVLRNNKELSLGELISGSSIGRDKVLWALENLSKRGAVNVRKTRKREIEITEEGKRYAETLLPEEKLLKSLEKGEINVAELKSREEQIGFLWAKKKELAFISGGTLKMTKRGLAVAAEGDQDRMTLNDIAIHGKSRKESMNERIPILQSRHLVEVKEREEIERIRISDEGLAEIEKGAGEEKVGQLNKSIIAGGNWKGIEFRKYDVNIKVEKADAALKHPLTNLSDDIKRAYVGLGFKEISGPIVEPSFWVFDSLFMPQDHPAREMQDTFYLAKPSMLKVKESEIQKRIGKAHKRGWKGDWNMEASEQAMLRTHVTSVSSRQIQSIVGNMMKGKSDFNLPLKFFSMGRVFRNESIDYKHLADFYQTDGIIIGKGLTLANLFDTLIKIYGSIGMKVSFKPSYFPFVEPGVEIRVFSEKTGGWIEIGGAGIIRREITGISRKKISVLAWGVTVERFLLLHENNISSISELYGSRIGWLRSRKMV